MNRIAPCLWFDGQAEEAARFYVSVFPDSRILDVSHYGKVGTEIHHRPPGSVMTVEFELRGQRFTALNAGPVFKFNEAISLQVDCDTQQEIDRYWQALGAGGDPKAQQCGWLKDKYGLSWQIVPAMLKKLVTDRDQAKADRAFGAMMQMKKLDIAKLQAAFDG